MRTSLSGPERHWNLVGNGEFQEFDEFAQSIRGWGVDFQQLAPGRGSVEMLQFGSPDFLVAHFRMSQPYDQRGSTPKGMLTLGLIESGAGAVMTPEGLVADDEIWCFSPDREFSCVSQPDFRAYGLSLSERVIDEVAGTCELQDVRETLGSNKVVRCQKNREIEELRNQMSGIAKLFACSNGEYGFHPPEQTAADERDFVRHVLQILDGQTETVRLSMSARKRLILRRVLEYLDANPKPVITVYELAEVVGAGVRTLEYVFRDYFGVTPKAYLTIRRLMGAQRELHRSDASRTLVRDVAFNWGFWHLGRFSADYYRFFGELPSHTLGAK